MYKIPKINDKYTIPDYIYRGLLSLATGKLDIKKRGNIENTLAGYLGEYALYKMFYPYSNLVPECLISIYSRKDKPDLDHGDLIIGGVHIDAKTRTNRNSILLSFSEIELQNNVDIFVLLNRIDDKTLIYKGCFPKNKVTDKYIKYIPQRGRRYEILDKDLICMEEYFSERTNKKNDTK